MTDSDYNRLHDHRRGARGTSCAAFCGKNSDAMVFYCMMTIGVFVAVQVVVAIVSIPLWVNWPLFEKDFCGPGNSLNPYEQMWCTPAKMTNITSNSSSNKVLFYRVNKANLPKVVTRYERVRRSFVVSPEHRNQTSFTLMSKSSMTAEVRSSGSSDSLYLMNHKQYVDWYINRKGDGDYMKSGEGTLQISVFTSKPNSYYIIAYRSGKGNSTVTIDADVDYVLYNLSSKEPVNCQTGKGNECNFSNVSSDEMIIAENTGEMEYDTEILLPRKLREDLVIPISVLCGLFELGAIVFTKCYLAFRREEVKKPTGEETTPLKGDTPTTPYASTNDSEKTPGGDTVKYSDEELPSYAL